MVLELFGQDTEVRLKLSKPENMEPALSLYVDQDTAPGRRGHEVHKSYPSQKEGILNVD